MFWNIWHLLLGCFMVIIDATWNKMIYNQSGFTGNNLDCKHVKGTPAKGRHPKKETFSFGHNLNLCLYLYCAYLYYLYFCLPEPHQSITRRKCILRMSSVSFIVIFGALALAGGKSQLISISIYKAWLVLHASQCWHNNLWIWYD